MLSISKYQKNLRVTRFIKFDTYQARFSGLGKEVRLLSDKSHHCRASQGSAVGSFIKYRIFRRGSGLDELESLSGRTEPVPCSLSYVQLSL